MNPGSASTDQTAAIRAAFARLTPVAMHGLSGMVTPQGNAFCFRAFADMGAGLRLEGRSERYGAMSLIGLAHQVRRGESAPLDTDPIADHLHNWALTAPDLGDTGLVLWSEILRQDERAVQTAESILSRQAEIFHPTYAVASMETGFLMLGLAHAMRAGIGGDSLSTLAEQTAALLLENQDDRSGLFSFGRKLRRKNVQRAATDSRLGSFASQVYPIMGLSAYASASGDEQAGRPVLHVPEELFGDGAGAIERLLRCEPDQHDLHPDRQDAELPQRDVRRSKEM